MSRTRALLPQAFDRRALAILAHAIAPVTPLPALAPLPASGVGTAEHGAPDIGGLDLGSRISMTAGLQQSAGNAAVAQLVAQVRTDHRKEPPDGMKELMATSLPGNRGLTRTRYTANPPIFRPGGLSQVDGQWQVRPAPVTLPPLDLDVYYPAPGRHQLRSLGKGSQYLDVTQEWSDRLLQGEEEHVGDQQLAWDWTWGAVARVINEMSNDKPSTGTTPDDAKSASWQEFKRRLPALLRPDGDTYTSEAQEAKWGGEGKTVFKQLMDESKRARDDSGWHTPDETAKSSEGDDRIDELAPGNSKIGLVKPEELIKQAWDRLASSGQ